MSTSTEKPPKIGTEITVRISLTFQEAPDIHTLLAMTPVRERGKLVRSALERYIADTAHPAGNVEQQINAISTWLRSRATIDGLPVRLEPPLAECETAKDAAGLMRVDVAAPLPSLTSQVVDAITEAPISSSINRWLEA
jgi:hypothetical protein